MISLMPAESPPFDMSTVTTDELIDDHVDAAVLEQSPGQHVGRTITHDDVVDTVDLVPGAGERPVQLVADHAAASARASR